MAIIGENPYPPLYVPALFSLPECTCTKEASMSMIYGLLAVASRAGFRGPAAAQTLERRLRAMVANP